MPQPDRTTQLAILQQSEYLWPVYSHWLETHRSYNKKLQPEWTLKARLFNVVSQFFFFLPVPTSIQLALIVLTIPDFFARKVILLHARKKLEKFQAAGLQVVAVAGSYGKTSTKFAIEHLLADQQKLLVTPSSYNTPLGIASVINQLTAQHQVFVVEFGEFLPGSIADLLALCRPSMGVLTPLGRQHLEIVGGFDQLTRELATFLDYFSEPNILIHQKNQTLFPAAKGKWYGTGNKADFSVEKVAISRAGTNFSVQLPGRKSLATFSPLYGEHQAVNTLPAFWLADKLHLDLERIAKRVASLPFVPHRHQPTFAENDVLILDNGYNTNPDSVESSLKLLDQLKPTKKFIVTLGFVEQGEDAAQVHQEFGQQLAKKVDYVGLIQGPNTEYIRQGFLQAGGKEADLFIGDTQETAFAGLQSKVVPGSVILFEGGYQEVFS